MKLFAKIFLCAMIVLSAALSLSGYLLITSAFRNAVRQETARAMDQHQYIKFLLQADLMDHRFSAGSSLPNLRFANLSELADQYLPGLSDGGNYIAIFGDDRTPLYSTLPLSPDLDMFDYDVEQQIVSKLDQIMGRVHVMVLGKIVQSDQTVYLLTATDVQAVIEQKDGMVRTYGAIYLVTIGLAAVLVVIFSAWLTGPMRRMSVVAGRIADGNYSERLVGFPNDEMGELSAKFNVMAQTIEERMAELSDIARQKEDFVSNFAHELKTPLTSVIGYADMIYQKHLSREETQKAAAYILDEGLRLEALSLKLMDLIVLNRQDFLLEQLPADELLQSIANAFEPLLRNDGIELSLAAERGYIRIDYDLIKTLLFNLIDNAVKAGSTEVSLYGQAEQQNYRITVSDNGCGIPADELHRITEAFYMVDKSRSRRQHGAGLGLALAARIAAVHGCRLEFHSMPGQGTTVSFSLPLEGGDSDD